MVKKFTFSPAGVNPEGKALKVWNRMADTLPQLLSAFQLEAAQLQTGYDLVLEKTGRTPAEMVRFIVAFVRGERPEHDLLETIYQQR